MRHIYIWYNYLMEWSELKIAPVFAREAVCCFTGNRPHKLPWGRDESRTDCIALKQRITDAVISLVGEGYRLFVCGMALGADIYFAESVMEAKKIVPEIYLECAVPCPEQTDGWDAADLKRYGKALELCDFITVVSPKYSPRCMLRRNRYMIDKSSVVVTADYGLNGGTASTVRYAVNKGLRIISLAGK